MLDCSSKLLLLSIDLCVKLGAEKHNLLKVRLVCVCVDVRSTLHLQVASDFKTLEFLKKHFSFSIIFSLESFDHNSFLYLYLVSNRRT